MPILFVSGVNDRSVIGVGLDEGGRLVHVFDGNASVHHRLPMREGVAIPFLIFGEGVKQRGVDLQTQPSLVFNQIADADTHRGALRRCIQLCEQLNTTVINHPANVLKTTRDQVAAALQGIPGVVVPRTVRFRPRSPDEVFSRAAAEGLEFPYIVRAAGEHGGRLMLRLDNRGDVGLLHALPFDGRDFYLIEFIDYRDEDGYYHKQRLAMIDGEVLMRHSLYDTDWKVHGASRAGMLARESWETLNQREIRLEKEVLPRAAAACAEIARRLGLEYFGIDGHLREDGKLIVFEANASMNILISRSTQRKARHAVVHKKVYRMLTRYSGEKVAPG